MKKRAIIISLGGTPKPLIKCLQIEKPEYICFFVSDESRKFINSVIEKIGYTPQHYDYILAENHQSLELCFKNLKYKIPEILDKWGVSKEDVIVDYTGGTKAMSSATVLATAEFCNKYLYVGGDDREIETGRVKNGKEELVHTENPWNVFAIEERKKASDLFNRGAYGAASEILVNAAKKVDKDERPLFNSLGEIIKGYNEWDKFQHSTALNLLNISYNRTFRIYAAASKDEKLKALGEHIKSNIDFLSRIESEKLYAHDLIANAKRKAEKEEEFDDAVARLYRAIEMIGQIELEKTVEELKKDDWVGNVKDGKIDLKLFEKLSLDDEFRELCKEKYFDEEKKQIKLSLRVLFECLSKLGNEIGKSFCKEYEKDLKKRLASRNNSILAHGRDNITKDTYEQLYNAVLNFSGIEESSLPRFPILDL